MEETDYIQQAQSIINSDQKKHLLNRTKGTVQGAFTGMVAGVMFGYFKNKNIYTTGFVGLLLGGIISGLLIEDLKEKK